MLQNSLELKVNRILGFPVKDCKSIPDTGYLTRHFKPNHVFVLLRVHMPACCVTDQRPCALGSYLVISHWMAALRWLSAFHR